MIRAVRPSDLSRLRELQNGYEWEFGEDLIDCLVAVDENDRAIMFVGSWKIAEAHCLMDPKWSTPGARLAMLAELHDAMNSSLKQKGYKQVVTWFDVAKERFCRRLERWGWIRSNKSSFHRSTY